MDLTAIPARSLRELMATGGVTAEAVTRSFLDRVQEREAAVGAWEVLGHDFALAQARACDRVAPTARGPLHGLPVGVKDLIDTADLPTRYGSAIYDGHRPAADATCVALARRAGAVVLGKTVTTELAYFQPGKTANPLSLEHTPGGSSSGSAAAVADRMAPLALGTQTAGSVIRPASFCGIVGFKPSFGLIPRAGVKLISDTLDTVGVFARDVADAAFFAAVLSGRPELRPPHVGDLPPMKIRILRPPYPGAPLPETIAILENAVAALPTRGAIVEDVATPEKLNALPELLLRIMAYEMARCLAHEHRVHTDRLSPKLLGLLEEGWSVPARAYDEAVAEAEQARRDLSDVFGDADAVLGPATLGEAPRGLSATGDPAFNRAWTLLHLPCATVPAGRGPNGLSIGLQIAGRRGDDARLLRAALTLESCLVDTK